MLQKYNPDFGTNNQLDSPSARCSGDRGPPDLPRKPPASRSLSMHREGIIVSNERSHQHSHKRGDPRRATVMEAEISSSGASGVLRAASGPCRPSGVFVVLLVWWRSRGEVGERRVRDTLVVFQAMQPRARYCSLTVLGTAS